MTAIFILILHTFFAPPSSALDGKWTGTITQNKGGYKTSYVMELYIVQKGNKITGKSYVKSDDIYAYFEIQGSTTNDYKLITFHDTKILKEKHFDNMEWCFKNAVLKLVIQKGVHHLEGDWSGKTKTTDCVPGKIYLQRARQRA
ncbi:MAG: hypothetical protein KBA06_02885 [Saprospiraceae bacterium]|nr:hypothetical protein [Saprospiraceae bacterium]